MDKLEKKIGQLKSTLSEFKPTIKMPSVPKPTNATPKLPGNPSASKKDPIKMAEQIKNPDLKPQAMDQAKEMKESLKVSKNGQWSL